MKKSHKKLIFAMLVVFVLGGILGAQERNRRGELRGVLVKLTERNVGEQWYLGVIVKPLESDDQLTVLVHRENEDLAHAVRMMREGDRLEISYVTEHGEKWINRIEVQRRQVERKRRPEEGREMEVRQERIRREQEPKEQRREGEKRIVIRREGEPGPEARREERMHREPSPPDMLEGPLRDVITRHMEQMGMELREILGPYIGRMYEELMELRAQTENMRREIEELRHENEMLRMQLRERDEQRRESDRVQRDSDRPRTDRDLPPREVQRDKQRDEKRDTEYREQREQEEHRDQDRDEAREPNSPR